MGPSELPPDLDAAALLTVWERGRALGLPERALALLEAVWPATDWADVAIGVRDRELLGLRELLFGATLEAAAPCQECGEDLELAFRAGDIVATAEPDLDALRVREGGYVVESRLPTTRDLLALLPGAPDPEGALLARCVESARFGEDAVDTAELPEHVRRRVAEGMARADPQADVRLAVACPACGQERALAFDIVSYLWAELDAWAQRVLAEVHALASAYGWSERDVLGMSALRRRQYLELQGI